MFITPEIWQEKYVISEAFVLNKLGIMNLTLLSFYFVDRKKHNLHFNFSQACSVHLSVARLLVRESFIKLQNTNII